MKFLWISAACLLTAIVTGGLTYNNVKQGHRIANMEVTINTLTRKKADYFIRLGRTKEYRDEILKDLREVCDKVEAQTGKILVNCSQHLFDRYKSEDWLID